MVKSECGHFVMTPKHLVMKMRSVKKIKWLAGGNSHEQNA